MCQNIRQGSPPPNSPLVDHVLWSLLVNFAVVSALFLILSRLQSYSTFTGEPVIQGDFIYDKAIAMPKPDLPAYIKNQPGVAPGW